MIIRLTVNQPLDIVGSWLVLTCFNIQLQIYTTTNGNTPSRYTNNIYIFLSKELI